jgi:archaellum component FlaC
MNRLQQQLNQDVNEFEKEKEKLHTKIADLRNELNDARRQTREIQSKMSELNAQLITARSDKSALESQVNRIQHKLKDVIDDFKSRLAKYVKDIAGYMDKVERRVSNDGSTPARMTQYVEDMLNDMKRLHHTREEQLSAAANTYRQRLEQTVRRHEELLMAYRDLRQQVEARGLTDVELGPDEHNMRLHTEPELASRQQRVIERLRDDLTQKQAELDALKLRMRVGQHGKQQQPDKTNQKLPAVSHSRDSHRDSTTEMQKKMNEFLLDTQKELEQERSRLRAENAMLKEEVKELERYIDNHLGRYADEIRRERKMIEELSTALKSMSHHRQTPVVSHDDFGKSSPRRNNRR